MEWLVFYPISREIPPVDFNPNSADTAYKDSQCQLAKSYLLQTVLQKGWREVRVAKRHRASYNLLKFIHLVAWTDCCLSAAQEITRC
jgi:hypothetical protein